MADALALLHWLWLRATDVGVAQLACFPGVATSQLLTDDPYLALDVGYLASEREISTAFKRLALLTHPDKTRGDDTEFKAINAAYQILNDPAEKLVFCRPCKLSGISPDGMHVTAIRSSANARGRMVLPLPLCTGTKKVRLD